MKYVIWTRLGSMTEIREQQVYEKGVLAETRKGIAMKTGMKPE